jgi:hypothetical protein
MNLLDRPMSLTERLNLAEDSRRGGFEPPGNAPEMPLPLMQGGDSDERMQHMLHKSLLITASQDSGWMDLAARRMQRRIHWFAPFAAVLLLISLSNCASTNQFFPHVSGRSFVDPWASCIRPDNETARPTYGLQHQPVFDAELCSQFLLDEYSVAHFSHGFLLLFWLVALPVRTLRGNHTCPACLGGIVLSLRSSPAEWPCFASPDDTSFDWMCVCLRTHPAQTRSLNVYMRDARAAAWAHACRQAGWLSEPGCVQLCQGLLPGHAARDRPEAAPELCGGAPRATSRDTPCI